MKLYKKTIIFCFLLVSCMVFSQESIIVWGTKPLAWKHFQAKLSKHSKFDANSHLKIKSTYSVYQDLLKCRIVAEFNTKKSKIKTKGIASKLLLKHEQLHFDIAEYQARLFRKELASYQFKSKKTIGCEMRKLRKKYYKLSKKMQSEYDAETNHSINEVEQKKWNRKVKFKLERSIDFSSPNISLDLVYSK
ncbi:DUF922 domain-containing protein [uncultured Algibacter sp.]|uniref:DUF922 domain-containing protein n=1 Tax=uncultured Algibacter sp. TaxID=298659 RepID=UPI003216528D